jgi:hypothetical protein
LVQAAVAEVVALPVLQVVKVLHRQSQLQILHLLIFLQPVADTVAAHLPVVLPATEDPVAAVVLQIVVHYLELVF